ncbi:MAG TPA: alpha-ketoacid dehydrogenase subunit beta [Myxococcota bacterium]|nr:alpha-ketoacid dehydrogenase subunit beta [Myxococcota bacterium]HQK50749.1 alpha-ketoacid dehydrogenase subunit beta [Myxococcota bacterium]
MAKRNMVEALNLALRQEMERDPSVIVLGQDVGINGGVFRVTDGLHARFGGDRVLDTPLVESGILGSAMGMAIGGLKPVAEIQFDGFTFNAMAQLEGNVSRYRSRSRGRWTVPLVLRFPYGGGVRALEHHSEAREALYALPGVKVVIPSGPRNARSLLVAAIRDPDPVVFLEPKRSYRAFKEEVPDEEEVGVIGQAQVVRPGTDVTVVSWGAMMRPVLEAVENLAGEASVEVVDLLTLHPMDVATIATSVRKTGRLVVVQEGYRAFGPSSEVVAAVLDEVFWDLEAPIQRVTGYDVVTPYFARESLYLPDSARVQQAIRKTLNP